MQYGRSCSSKKKRCGASEHIVQSAGVSLCNCPSGLGGPSSRASSYPRTVLLHSTPNHPHSLSQPRVRLNLNVMVCALTSPPAKRTVTLPLPALPTYPAAAAAAPSWQLNQASSSPLVLSAAENRLHRLVAVQLIENCLESSSPT